MDQGIFGAAAAEAMFTHASLAMTVLARYPDGHAELLALNPVAAAVRGWDRETIEGTPVSALLPADDAARTEGFIAQVDAPGSVVDYRVEVEVGSGRRTYEVRLIGLGEDGGRFLVLSMSNDVTRREMAESALEETQRLGRIGHWSWNLETDEVTWTPQLYELLGVEQGTPVTIDSAFALVDDPDAFRAAVDAALARGEAYEFEFDFTRPDGQRRRAVARGRSVLGRDGQVVRIAGTTQDVTEQRAAEADTRLLERARARQSQALELNDDVLQGLATVRVALMQDEHETAIDVLDRTLEAARTIISDLLRDHLGTGPIPGDLVRRGSAAAFDGEEEEG